MNNNVKSTVKKNNYDKYSSMEYDFFSRNMFEFLNKFYFKKKYPTQDDYFELVLKLATYILICSVVSYGFLKHAKTITSFKESFDMSGKNSISFTSCIKTILGIFIAMFIVDYLYKKSFNVIINLFFKKRKLLDIDIVVLTLILSSIYVLFSCKKDIWLKNKRLNCKEWFKLSLWQHNKMENIRSVIDKWPYTIFSILSNLVGGTYIMLTYKLIMLIIKKSNKDKFKILDTLSKYNARSQIYSSFVMMFFEFMVFSVSKFWNYTTHITIFSYIAFFILIFLIPFLFWLTVIINNLKLNIFLSKGINKTIKFNNLKKNIINDKQHINNNNFKQIHYHTKKNLIDDLQNVGKEPIVFILIWLTIFYFLISSFINNFLIDLIALVGKNQTFASLVRNFFTKIRSHNWNIINNLLSLFISHDNVIDLKLCKFYIASTLINLNNFGTGCISYIWLTKDQNKTIFSKKNIHNDIKKDDIISNSTFMTRSYLTFIKTLKYFFIFLICLTIFILLNQNYFLIKNVQKNMWIMLFITLLVNYIQSYNRTLKYILLDKIKELIFFNLISNGLNLDVKTSFDRLSFSLGRLWSEIITWCNVTFPGDFLFENMYVLQHEGIVSITSILVLTVSMCIFIIMCDNKESYNIIRLFELDMNQQEKTKIDDYLNNKDKDQNILKTKNLKNIKNIELLPKQEQIQKIQKNLTKKVLSKDIKDNTFKQNIKKDFKDVEINVLKNLEQKQIVQTKKQIVEEKIKQKDIIKDIVKKVNKVNKNDKKDNIIVKKNKLKSKKKYNLKFKKKNKKQKNKYKKKYKKK